MRALAAAQTIPQRGDVAANLADHVRLIREAAREKVRLIVFPELSLTGYELDLAEELAFSERDERLAPLLELAALHDMTIVAGAPARIGSQLYIGAFIIAPDGSTDVYTKQRMGAFPPEANPGGPVPPAERTAFRPGDRNPLLRLGDSSAAIAICADIHMEEHPRAAARRGASVYLASMFVIPADYESDWALLRTYARTHRMTVVFANFGGPSGGLPSAGGSAIISANGSVLAQLGEAGAGVAIDTRGVDDGLD